MTNLDSILKSRDITLPIKVHLIKAIVFPVIMYGCESWTVKKAERQRIDAFELWCWRRLLSVPWTSRRSNQSILKENSPEYLLEGLMLKLKLQSLATWCEEVTHWKDPDCQGSFNFKGSNMFSSFVCRFSRTLCSLSVPRKQEWAELHAVLRTEIMGKDTCLDSLQWLSSVTLYLKDYPFCCNCWNFVLLNGWIIILLKIY